MDDQTQKARRKSLAQDLVATRSRVRRWAKLALPSVIDDAFWSVWRSDDWVPGADHMIWEEVHGGPAAHRTRRVPKRLAAILLELERDARGWATPPRGGDYPEFVKAESWRARHRTWADRVVFGGLARKAPEPPVPDPPQEPKGRKKKRRRR